MCFVGRGVGGKPAGSGVFFSRDCFVPRRSKDAKPRLVGEISLRGNCFVSRNDARKQGRNALIGWLEGSFGRSFLFLATTRRRNAATTQRLNWLAGEFFWEEFFISRYDAATQRLVCIWTVLSVGFFFIQVIPHV